MHTRRFIRNGEYGKAAAIFLPNGEHREILKVFVRPDLKRQISELADDLGIRWSQWAELALHKEAAAAMRRKAERDSQRAAV